MLCLSRGAAGVLLAIASLYGASAAPAETAQQILDAVGCKGGLVVHLGCGDGRLTAALRAGDAYIVHGLDADAANVEKAREHIRSLGLYGPVSVEQGTDPARLPYADNLVNLLVISDARFEIAEKEMQRVLAPLGAAYIRGKDGQWAKTVKPWPKDIDEWTHWLHDAGGNAVARDTRVGPPRCMQWVAEPLWSRGHEVVSSVGSVVTARGRLVYALDEGQPGIYALPSKWVLVARDAFNGVLLWKRPIPNWNPPLGLAGFSSGFRPRRLVADGERIFLPMGEEAVLTSLDAATGKTLGTLDAARGTSRILCADGLVVALASPQGGADGKGKKASAGAPVLLAARPDTFEVLWQMPAAAVAGDTLALGSGRVFFMAGGEVVALDAAGGREAWRSAFAKASAAGAKKPAAGAATLVVHDGRMYVHSGPRLAAFAAATGKELWSLQDAPTSKGELFAAAGLLWRTHGAGAVGHDPATGEVRKTVDASDVFCRGHHLRCYPSKATDRYIITNNRGAEFVALAGAGNVENDWLRGNCGHGVMPANGLLYAPPNQCMCYPGVLLTGFKALAAGPLAAPAAPAASDPARLERGPAYEAISNLKSGISEASDWPTYRHDPARFGATAAAVPAAPKPLWQATLGGHLTPPVAAGGTLLVAAPDAYAVHALAAADGRRLWSFTAGGRIDSPPTVHEGLVLAGCADGWVYCLRAADGQLAWRFRAAPDDRRIGAMGRLESAWPVHGSVLVAGGVAYVTAGRSSYLDGGIWLFGLDPKTGRVLHEARLDTWAPTRKDAEHNPFIPAYHIEGARSDVLVSEGGFIYLGQAKFDMALRPQEVQYVMPRPDSRTAVLNLAGKPFVSDDAADTAGHEKHQREWLERTQPGLLEDLNQAYGGYSLGQRSMGRHVLSTGGLLDDTWFNRTFWMYAPAWPGYYLGHRGAKTGQLLVVGPEKTYAVQAYPSRNLQSAMFTPGRKGYLLLADANDNDPVLSDQTRGTTKGWGYTRAAPPAWFQWLPVRMRGMVLAGRTLFVAGPPDVMDEADPYAAFEGRRGAVLLAVSADDGRTLAQFKLESEPVFDGLIAAGGRLYTATADGKVICLGK